tara:strand:+ start:10 stop:237 length:228 start_codon:yes stop_codon:yes gene_type:complete
MYLIWRRLSELLNKMNILRIAKEFKSKYGLGTSLEEEYFIKKNIQNAKDIPYNTVKFVSPINSTKDEPEPNLASG